MGIEVVKICSICKRMDCDGKEFILPKRKSQYGDMWLDRRILCSSQIFEKGKKYFYHEIAGHGVEANIEVKPR
jgi:hypothetical protein